MPCFPSLHLCTCWVISDNELLWCFNCHPPYSITPFLGRWEQMSIYPSLGTNDRPKNQGHQRLEEYGWLQGSCIITNLPQHGWQFKNLGALCMTCRQLDKPESLLSSAVLTAYVTSSREGPCVSGKFQGLPGTCEMLSPWVLTSLPSRWTASTAQQLLHNNPLKMF